jgi:hypothetical protein
MLEASLLGLVGRLSKTAMRVTPGINQPYKLLMQQLRRAPVAPVSVNKNTGMAQNIYDWLTHRQFSNLNSMKNNAVLTAASDLARSAPERSPGNIPGLFDFFMQHYPKTGKNLWRELTGMYERAPVEGGTRALKMYPSGIEPDRLLPSWPKISK